MKRITAIAVAAAMMLSTAPVFASQVSFEGSLKNKVWYDFSSGSSSKMSLDMELSANLLKGTSLRGVVLFKPIDWSAISGAMGNKTPTSALDLANLIKVRKAYVETDGPFWQNGPSMTTRLGDLDLNYSPYILDSDSVSKYESRGFIEGISISGLNLGPVKTGAFYGWNNGMQVYGAQASTNMLKTQLDGSFVKLSSGELDLTAKAVYKPSNIATITGIIARQTNTKANAFKLNADFNLPHQIALKTSFRTMDSAFSPYYKYATSGYNELEAERGETAIAASANKDFGKVNVNVAAELLGKNNNKKMNDELKAGVNLATKLCDINLAGGYQAKINLHNGKTTHTTKFSAAIENRKISDELILSASYNATLTNLDIAGMRHVVKVTATSPLKALKNVSVYGMYDTKPGTTVKNNVEKDNPTMELGVKYAAPNGVTLGYSCLNFKDRAANQSRLENRVYAELGMKF